ncbi:MAG: hypothetical protein ABR499_06425 [Gemmatimonadaceae bacterium]
MGSTNRALRLVTALLTVWCLGCDAFESVGEWLGESHARPAAAADVATQLDGAELTVRADDENVGAGDACHCVLGHAAVVSAVFAAEPPSATLPDFVDRPRAVPLPAPEPRLRPPLA